VEITVEVWGINAVLEQIYGPEYWVGRDMQEMLPAVESWCAENDAVVHKGGTIDGERDGILLAQQMGKNKVVIFQLEPDNTLDC